MLARIAASSRFKVPGTDISVEGLLTANGKEVRMNANRIRAG